MVRTSGDILSPSQKKKLVSVAKLLNDFHKPSVPSTEGDGTAHMLYVMVADASSPTTARKALKLFKQKVVDWNELRIFSAYLIEGMLREARVKAPCEVAQMIRRLLTHTYEELCHVRLEQLAEADQPRLKAFLAGLGFLPPSIYEYLLVVGGLSQDPPLDPATIRVLERLGVFAKTLDAAQRREAVAGLIEAPLLFHHTLSDHGRKVCMEEAPRCDRCVASEHCAFAKRPRAKKKAAPKKTAKAKVGAARKRATGKRSR